VRACCLLCPRPEMQVRVPKPMDNGPSDVPLSVCLSVCLSVQLFGVHCMSVSWQLHSQCAAALLILFQLCACECFVSLMGTFDFHFSYCNYSLDTQIHTNTHTSQRTLLSAKYWLQRPFEPTVIPFLSLLLFAFIKDKNHTDPSHWPLTHSSRHSSIKNSCVAFIKKQSNICF